MPEGAPALHERSVARAGIRTFRADQQIHEHPHPEQHVHEVNAGEHVVEAIELVAIECDAGGDLAGPFEYFGDEKTPAAAPEGEHAGARPGRARRHVPRLPRPRRITSWSRATACWQGRS